MRRMFGMKFRNYASPRTQVNNPVKFSTYEKIGAITGIPIAATGFCLGMTAWDGYDEDEKISLTAKRMGTHAFSTIGMYGLGMVLWPILSVPFIIYTVRNYTKYNNTEY